MAENEPFKQIVASCLPARTKTDAGRERAAGLLLSRLAAAGYHVVQEGQAVVDGRVWGVEDADAYDDGSVACWLRPLTDEATS